MSGHVIHGAKLGRTLGFPTLNLRVAHRPALAGIFVVQVHGLADSRCRPSPAWACARPSRMRPHAAGSPRVRLATSACYGKLVRVEFLEKLRDEEKYIDLPTLTAAIDRDAPAGARLVRPARAGALTATDRI